MAFGPTAILRLCTTSQKLSRCVSQRRRPFDHPDWLFELKHDGLRVVAYTSDDNCELVSRKGKTYKRFESGFPIWLTFWRIVRFS